MHAALGPHVPSTAGRSCVSHVSRRAGSGAEKHSLQERPGVPAGARVPGVSRAANTAHSPGGTEGSVGAGEVFNPLGKSGTMAVRRGPPSGRLVLWRGLRALLRGQEGGLLAPRVRAAVPLGPQGVVSFSTRVDMGAMPCLPSCRPPPRANSLLFCSQRHRAFGNRARCR